MLRDGSGGGSQIFLVDWKHVIGQQTHSSSMTHCFDGNNSALEGNLKCTGAKINSETNCSTCAY